MAVTIRCPFCETKFRWFAATERYPDRCPSCDQFIGNPDDDDTVVAPNILHFTTRCTDGVYKAMEKSSEQRAYAAAEMAGVSVSEMSDLKITNLRDNTREGEIAAMPVVNEVTRQMDAVNARGGGFGFGGGAEAGLAYSGPVGTGPTPNAGARTQFSLRNAHADRMMGHLAGGEVQSTRPAMEITHNPNYRPRV